MDLVPNSSLHEGLEDFFDATDSQLLRLWTQTHDRGAYSSMQVLIGFFSLSEKDWKDDAPLRAALNALGEAAHEDASSGGDLSFSEFLACAHVVKMCALLALSGDGSGELSVCDYSPSRCELVPNLAVELRRDWLQHRRPSWSRNRWVHLTQAGHELHATRQTLKLVASKYGLHPLAIEDALEERHRAKCSRYEGHIFVLFPAIDIDRRAYQSDSHTLRLGKQSSDKRVSLQMRLVAIFLTAPHLNTLVSYATDDRDACGRVPPGFQQLELSRQDALHMAVTKARRRLQRNYSILRSAPASLLLHRFLDGLVDAIGPAADALEHVVEELLEQVRGLPLVASEGVPSPERIRQEFVEHVRALERKGLAHTVSVSMHATTLTRPQPQIGRCARRNAWGMLRPRASPPTSTTCSAKCTSSSPSSARYRVSSTTYGGSSHSTHHTSKE
jgi:hypothetical protein